MDFIVALVREYGVGIVFLNVLIEQLGAPIPAYPVLMVTGAIHGDSLSQQLLLIAVAVSAALIADGVWYAMGRRYGRRVLARVCKVSLSPDSCVQNTESLYSRWGAKSLLIAKFVPGFASIASALAGAVGTSPTRFALFDGLGALLWVGSAVLLGGAVQLHGRGPAGRAGATGPMGPVAAGDCICGVYCTPLVEPPPGDPLAAHGAADGR